MRATRNQGPQAHAATITFRSDRFTGNHVLPIVGDASLSIGLYGIATHRSRDGSIPVEPGVVLMVRPGVVQSYDDCEAFQVATCRFPAWLAIRDLQPFLDASSFALLSRANPVTPLVTPAERFREVAALATGSPLDGPMGRLGRLLLILEALSRGAGQPPRPIHASVAKVLQSMTDDVSRPWSLQELAGLANLDPSYLTRMFNAELGGPPMAYLSMLRAEKAANMLLHTDCGCGHAGSRVGWTDPNYFARRFRQHFGLSPTAYRERAAAAHES